jgi:hypothetical protein
MKGQFGDIALEVGIPAATNGEDSSVAYLRLTILPYTQGL